MKGIGEYGVYHLFETADRDGPVWEIHVGSPPTRVNLVHSGTNLFWAQRIAKALAEQEKRCESPATNI